MGATSTPPRRSTPGIRIGPGNPAIAACQSATCVISDRPLGCRWGLCRDWVHAVSRFGAWKVALVEDFPDGPVFCAATGTVQQLGCSVIGLASISGFLLGIRLDRPADKATWLLFATGSFFSIAADGI